MKSPEIHVSERLDFRANIWLGGKTDSSLYTVGLVISNQTVIPYLILYLSYNTGELWLIESNC